MKSHDSEVSEKETFRAHVWSPLNKGEAILEITVGTTVEELLETLSKVWGAQFRPARGFLYRRTYIAGWCVLCRSASGVFYPLGIDDVIPTKPVEDQKDEDEVLYGRSTGWFWQTLPRAERVESIPKDRADEGDSIVTEEDIAEIIESELVPRWEKDSHVKKSATKGIIYTGPSGFVRDPELQVLMSGPAPKEDVDIRLAVIIAVSGT